jgi:hypothetical protein
MIEHRAAVRESWWTRKPTCPGVPWKGCAGSEIR